MQSLKIITIHKTAIDRFKLSWPCNGIPESADLLVAAFSENGDLVDYEFCDGHDKTIEDNTWDGTGALSALLDDAWTNAIETNLSGIINPINDYR